MNEELDQLAAAVGQALLARGWHFCCAESCTGGWLAASLTSIPGSSSWFERGFITYSNAAKIELLDVAETLLNTQGAVSEATVAAMTAGALRHAHADVAIAISGIAGPTGGSTDKPVGTVCIAWQLPAQAVHVQTCHFSGNRQQIRHDAVKHALQILLQRLSASASMP